MSDVQCSYRARSLTLAAMLVLAGASCTDRTQPVAESPSAPPEYLRLLKVIERPFDLMVEDMDGNGLKDISIIYHASNLGVSYFQQEHRTFEAAPPFEEVGFHPGDLLRWPGQPGTYLLAAEGENALKIFNIKGTQKPALLGVVPKIPKPRYLSAFDWPNWGTSLILSPFDQDQVVFIKGFDPDKPAAAKPIGVPLAKRRPSVLYAERITQADVDGDGVVELLFPGVMDRQVMSIRQPKTAEALPEVKELYYDKTLMMPSQVKALDVNQDQALDLLVSDGIPPGRIHVLINDKSGQFTEASTLDYFADQSRGIVQLEVATEHTGHQYMVAYGESGLTLYKHRLPSEASEPEWDRVEISTEAPETSGDMVISDVDGDGWLDLVLGRSNTEYNLAVVYGPLWDHFKDMEKNHYRLPKD